MLGVILTILKILGIILLVILGLILTLVLVVLFVPIRYKSRGYVEKTDEGILDNISVKVTWLLHIVSVKFDIDGKDSKLSIKIFGRELGLGKSKKPKTSKSKPKQTGYTASHIEIEPKAETQDIKKSEVTKSLEDSNSKKDTGKPEVKPSDDKNTEDKPKEKKSLKQRFTDILEKIKGICQKIKNINAMKNAFVEYLRRDESKIAIREIKQIIFKAIKSILPRKFRADVTFGFSDPATTGNVLGVLSIFYGIYGNKLNLNPNFDQEQLKLKYDLKGRIRIFTLLVAAFKIYRNQWIKDFIAFSKETVKN